MKNNLGKWHLRLTLTLIYAGLLLATDGASWQGWNLLGNLAGFIVSAAILVSVYLGNKIWLWFTRALLWLFALAFIISGASQPPPLTVKLVTVSGALIYTLWALGFSNSVRQHWRAAREKRL